MTGRQLHDIKQIVAMLSARIEQLARELLPAGRKEGTEWRCGSVAGEPGQSLGVHLAGDKAGIWADFSTADPRHRGDALDLVAMTRFGGDKTQALRWARAWLGLERGGPAPRQVQAVRPEEIERQERDAEGKRQRAISLFLQGKPLQADDPAALYLAGRGLDLRQFGRVPRALRFLPNCWCQEASQQLPAMLAAVTRRGHHVATHRTYLMAERGTWRKARLAAPKKVLGQLRGGFIPLWRGASGRPIAEAQEGEQLAIAEGIEDTLTVALHMPEARAIAAVSLSNMAAVELPEACNDVLLIFDRDGENAQARVGRLRAARTLLEQGRSVREAFPPEGFKDFNAWHQAQQRTATA